TTFTSCCCFFSRVLLKASGFGLTNQSQFIHFKNVFLLPGRQPASLNARVVGGNDAPDGAWPWQVSLQWRGRPFCGASLISRDWVLTAAHCVTGFLDLTAENWVVYLGRMRQKGSNTNEVSRKICRVVRHPGHNSFAALEHDIALLRLSSPVTFTDYIQPVCLAAEGSRFGAGTPSWVTGWGRINYMGESLQEVEVPVVGGAECQLAYNETGLSITENMICAGLLTTGGKDSCQGDSGGPMVSRQGTAWVQSGIVSFGKGCAEPYFPGVYTRVSQYQKWISSHITGQQPGFVKFNSTEPVDPATTVTDAPTMLFPVPHARRGKW
uniref:Peptidase S1 domain-containing protein n=1 Tax=Denticeps clupeoides TaxID=299321 RepID=A0AAY4CGV6_9TELE